MTLKVNRQILDALSCCASGIDTFQKRLGGRADMDYQEFLELAFEMEKTLPEEKYVYFTVHLRSEPKFYLLQGAYTMTDKFQVFNHKTGQHEPFNSLEEAKARRQQIIDEFIAEHNSLMFNINREILVNDGQDAMWVPLSELPSS